MFRRERNQVALVRFKAVFIGFTIVLIVQIAWEKVGGQRHFEVAIEAWIVDELGKLNRGIQIFLDCDGESAESRCGMAKCVGVIL